VKSHNILIIIFVPDLFMLYLLLKYASPKIKLLNFLLTRVEFWCEEDNRTTSYQTHLGEKIKHMRDMYILQMKGM